MIHESIECDCVVIHIFFMSRELSDAEDNEDANRFDVESWLEQHLTDHGVPMSSQQYEEIVEGLGSANPEDVIDADSDSSSDLDSAPGAERAQAVVQTFTEFLDASGLQNIPRTGARFDIQLKGSLRPIGYLQIVGRSVKMSCFQNHGSCTCWITPKFCKINDLDLWCEGIHWCVQGQDKTAAAHQESAQKLRASYGS